MKRHGNLWERMISFENLLRAAEKARRGKRFRPAAARFFFHLERELWRLHEELATKTYRPGPYRTFFIYEPKQRQISAAPFRDRVVHHALTGVLEPIFERSFIPDSYACRKGKGTHAAVDRCQEFARRFRYVLKADVRKFFPSIDHEILKDLVARKIKDPHVLWLVEPDHRPQQPAGAGRCTGSPATTCSRPSSGGGACRSATRPASSSPTSTSTRSTTSSRTGCGSGYVRYVDDFLVFADDKRRLPEVRDQISEFLERLRLRIHPDKSVMFPCDAGHPLSGLPGLPDAPAAGQGERPPLPSPHAEDAGGVRGGSDRIRGDPPPDHELDRPRPARRHLSPAGRPVS